jgi:hypothetical protein
VAELLQKEQHELLDVAIPCEEEVVLEWLN